MTVHVSVSASSHDILWTAQPVSPAFMIEFISSSLVLLFTRPTSQFVQYHDYPILGSSFGFT